MTIEAWLVRNGLEKYAPLFLKSEITYDLLLELTEADLDKLRLPVGAHRRLLSAIDRLRHAESLRYAERRQLTVMFCDMVSYTELSGRLDAEELARLTEIYYRACEDVVERYEGHVAQYVGDGVMAYFGKPISHEDDAERSVHAALEIIRAIQQLPVSPSLAVRIGIATGPVVIGEPARPDDAASGFARGYTPNLAARLQAAARPNEVVIGELTRQLVGAAFDLTDLGEQYLKGFANAIRVWRVDGARPAASRFDAARDGLALTPLVGRESEIDALLQAWRSASEGDGRVMLISGAPGVGKSRLTRALRESISGQSYVSLRYQCSPHHRNSALYPVIQHFELMAGFSREDTAEQKLDKMQAVLADGGENRRETGALLAAMLGLPVDRLPISNLSPRKQKGLTLQVLVEQIEALSRRHPVLIVFEDVQWIDPTTEEALDLLIARAKAMPVLVLITFRPEYEPHWTEYRHVLSLMLDHLHSSHVEKMVHMIAEGITVPRRIVEIITQRADGVPLFVEELTKSALESGLLTNVDSPFWHGGLAGRPIPATLHDALAARVDRPALEKRVLQIGACIGRTFPYRLLSRVSAFGDEDLSKILHKLSAAGLVFSTGNMPDATYTFKHALLQDAVYDSLVKDHKQRFHAQIAQAYEEELRQGISVTPELLAHHYTEAQQVDLAIPMWREAGELALRRVAYQESNAHFDRALQLLNELPPSRHRDELELSIREPLNGTLIAWRGWAAKQVHDNAAATLSIAEREGRSRSLLVGMYGVWISTLTQGRAAEALSWAERLLDEGRTSGDIDMRVLGHTGCMITNFYLGHLLKAREHGLQADALYEPGRAKWWMELTGHDTRSVYLGWCAHWTWMMGYPDQAVRISDQMDMHARKLNHALDLGYALTVGAYPFDYRQEPEALFRRVRDAERIARDHAIPILYEVMVPQVEGLARLRGKQFSQAIILLNKGIENWRKLDGRTRLPYLQAGLAEALAQQGEFAQALETVDRALAQIEEPGCGERCHLAEVLRVRGWILMEQGEWVKAEASLRQSIEWARTQQAKSWELRSATTLATLLSRRGERDAARNVLTPVYSWFTEGFETLDLKAARSLLHSVL